MPTRGRTFSTCRLRVARHRTRLWACCCLLLVVAGAAQADDAADSVITPLPPIGEETLKEIQPQRDQTIFDRIRLAGWERRPADLGISWRLETGWVFGRLVEYSITDTADYRPSDTFLVHAGIWY